MQAEQLTQTDQRHYRITKWPRLEGTSKNYLVPPPTEQDHAEHTVQDGIHVGFEKETPQPLWETCSSALSPLQ